MALDLIGQLILFLIVAEAGFVLALGAAAALVIVFDVESRAVFGRLPDAAVPIVVSTLAAAAMVGAGRFLLGA